MNYVIVTYLLGYGILLGYLVFMAVKVKKLLRMTRGDSK